MTGSPWLIRFRPVVKPALRLFCVPYAGGGASVYRLWAQEAPPDIEVIAVQLPGRENRLSEHRLDSMESVLPPLLEALSMHLDVPFALFGHSLGAAIAYELALGLEARAAGPLLTVVSGRRAPHITPLRPPAHALPESEFRARLADMGGTPREILEHAELMGLFLPLLRADFRMSETYGPKIEPARLSGSVLALAGADDEEAPPPLVAQWERASGGRFRFECLSGGHFFLNERRGEIMRLILDEARAMPDRATALRC